MAETQDQVSVEAFNRVKAENATLKEQVAKLEPVVRDTALRDRAYDVFKGMEGVADPYGVATAAVRDVTLRDVDSEALPERLNQWFEQQRRAFASPAAPPPAGVEPDPDPASPTPAAPPIAGGFNPVAPGAPPNTAGKMLTSQDPEYRQVLESEGLAGIKRLVAEGRFKPHAQNPYGQELTARR